MILAFVKAGDDAAGDYRATALTSHSCKLMEKMIVKRLDYFTRAQRTAETTSKWIL